MNTLFEKLMKIAETSDVSTPENGLVLFSVSFLPTKENRDKAILYVKQNAGKVLIDDTVCGKALIENGIDNETVYLSSEMKAKIWAVASRRMIREAKGMVTAFVDGADRRSVFCSVELPEILKNDQIISINGEDKKEFAKRFLS